MSGNHEYGAGPAPTGETAMTAEEKQREERLMAIQMEALGFQRRERISTEDSRRKQTRIDTEALETSRLVNKAGSGAFKKAQENQGGLSSWNNAWKSLAADSSTEVLESLDDGQSHRAGLSAKLVSNYDDDLGNLQAGRGGRGAGSGRGGGIMGTRARGNWRQVPARTPSHPWSDTTPTTFGPQDARERIKSSSDRKAISFNIPKLTGNDKSSAPMSRSALQLRQTIKDMPPSGPKGKQGGKLPFQNATGSRGQPSRARAAATTSVPRGGSKQPRQPSPDYESRLASPEAFMAAGTRISSQRHEPQSTSTSSTGIPPPQATSAAGVFAPPVRSSPTEPPTPTPTVRLPKVAPKPVSTATQQESQPENSARPRRKSVRFADFSEDTTSANDDTLFGAQVDLAPVGVHVLSTPQASMARSPPSKAASSYFDDLLGLEIEQVIAPETDASQIGTATTGEIEDEKLQRSESQAGDADYHEPEDHEEIRDNQEAEEEEKEVASLNHMISSLHLTGLAPRELIAYYEDRLAEVQARMQEDLSSARRVPNCLVAETPRSVSGVNEAPAAEGPEHPVLSVTQSDAASKENVQGLSPEAGHVAAQRLTRNTEASDNSQSEEYSIIGEHIHKSRFNRRSSTLSQREPQPTPVATSQATARPSPLNPAPQASIDLCSSLRRTTVVDLPYRTVGGRSMHTREHVGGDNIIGERVLPGVRSPSQAAQSTTSAGRPSNAYSPTGAVSATSTITVSNALLSTTSTQATTVSPSGELSDTFLGQSSSRNSSVAWPDITGRVHPVIAETAAAQQYGGPPTVEASSSATRATQDGLEATLPPQATSIARPNITGRVLPNIPDSAATRQYARSITSESASSNGTIIAAPEATQPPRTNSINQPSVIATTNTAESTAPQTNARPTQAATATTSNLSSPSSTASFPPTHGVSDARPNVSGGHWAPSHVLPQTIIVPQLSQPLPSNRQQPIAPSAPLASSSHAPRDNTRSSRRGAAPMTSPFLQSLQGASALPASGVGSATWMQYNQGPAPPPRSSAAGSRGPIPVPPTQTSSAAIQPSGPASPTSKASPRGNPGALSPKRTKQLPKSPAKDAWGKVRRAGN